MKVKLNDKIKNLRGQLNFSYRKLCNTSNINYTTYYRLENGTIKNPRIDTLMRLAEVFDMTLFELLDGTEFDTRIKRGE